MRNKIITILAILVAMTGIASAEYTDTFGFTCQGNEGNGGECLKASFDKTKTQIDATAKSLDSGKCYQIRYESSDLTTYYLGPHFSTEPYSEALNSLHDPVPVWTPGTWKVKLMKGGETTSGGCTNSNIELTSLKVTVDVPVDIPEFSTIALPIAAVIGLVFFFQHKKRKEE